MCGAVWYKEQPFEITITKRALSEFLIGVIDSPRTLLGVSLILLWVSHIPRIRLGVSLRSLSSRPLRGFIYSNFLSLLHGDGEEGFLRACLATVGGVKLLFLASFSSCSFEMAEGF
jgi:hypothetical protein